MLRLWICGTHMGGFWGPKVSKQRSLFPQTFLKHGKGWVKICKNKLKMGSFLPKFTIKVGTKKGFGN